MISILGPLLVAGVVSAVVPAERAARRHYVQLRLVDLPLSKQVLNDLRDLPEPKARTVADFVRLTPEARRAQLGPRPWIESEIARDVARLELRLTLSALELEMWIEQGRIPKPGLLSAVAAMPLGPSLRRLFENHGCVTLGDVRRRFLVPMIYAVQPLTPPIARAMREELTQLPLPESEMVLRLEEARFAHALGEARLGKRAREFLRDRGVTSFRDLRALELEEIEARQPLGKKMVKQIRALWRSGCGERFEGNH